MTAHDDRIVFIPDHPGGLFAADPQRPDGADIHIDDASRGSSGLVCPECRRLLVARKGRIRSHHFAHKASGGNEDGPICARAGETALHRLAKVIVEQAGGLDLPGFTISTWEGRRTLFEPGWHAFQEVHPESAEEGMRPDLIATYRHADGRTGRIAIEFRVRHRVNEDKRARFAEMGLSAVEIDLSVVDRELDRRGLASRILHGAPRVWLYNAKGQAKQDRAHEEAEARRREREAAEAEAQAKKVRARKAFEAEHQDVLRARKEARRARPRGTDEKTRAWAKEELSRWSSIGRQPHAPKGGTNYMFDAEREVWQAAILSVVAPWGDGASDHTLSSAAMAAAATLRQRGLVKVGYINRIREDPDEGEWAADPVRVVCEELLAGIVAGGRTGSAFADLSSIRADWTYLHRLHDLLREIAARAADHDVCVHIGGWIVSKSITPAKTVALVASVDDRHTLSPSDLRQVLGALVPGHTRAAWSGPRDPILAAAERLGLKFRHKGEDVTEDLLSRRPSGET